MIRTTWMLPEDLKTRAHALAKERGISFGELVRRALEAELTAARESAGRDPFYADGAVWKGPAPSDLSSDPDKYLYGPPSDGGPEG